MKSKSTMRRHDWYENYKNSLFKMFHDKNIIIQPTFTLIQIVLGLNETYFILSESTYEKFKKE